MTQLRRGTEPGGALPRATLRAVVLVYAFAVGVRLFGLDFGRGLPYVSHPDEPTQFAAAARMLSTPSANPKFFKYPSLGIYVETLGIAIGCAFESDCRTSKLTPPQLRTTAVGRYPSSGSVLGGRALAVLVSALAVPVVFWLTHLLTGARWLAFLAMLAVALHPEHARLSQFLTVDAIGATFALLAAACIEAWSRVDTNRLLMFGAAASGAAISSKYSYVFWAAGLALWIAWRLWNDRRRAELLGALTRFGCVCVALFAVTSPYVILTPRQAGIDFLSEVHHYGTGHLGLTESAAMWYLRYLGSTHVVVLVGGVLGGIVLLRRLGRPGGALTLALGLFTAAICAQSVYFDRNALAVALGLVPLAAVGVRACLDYAGRRLGVPVGFGAAALAASMLLPELGLIKQLADRVVPSPRARAQAWLERLPIELGAPSGLRHVAESYTVWLPHGAQAVYERSLADRPSLVAEADAVWIGSGNFRRFFTQGEKGQSKQAIYRQLLGRAECRCFRRKPSEAGTNIDDVCVIPVSERAKRLLAPHFEPELALSAGTTVLRELP